MQFAVPAPWRRIVLVVLLLGLASCSSTTFFYNRLDFLVPWYVEDYVDLDRMQEVFLEEQLNPFLDWHRREELPRYVETVDLIEDAVSDSLEEEELLAIQEDFEAAYRRLEARGMEWMLALGGELTDEQMDEFLDSLQERQEEFEEEYLDRDAEEFVQDSYDNLVDNLEDYLGGLGKEQEMVARRAAEDLVRADAAWLDEQSRWLAQLRVFLQREPGWEERLKTAVAVREQNFTPEYAAAIEHNTQVLYQTVSEIINSRSEKQDKALREKLGELREDLLALAAQQVD
ncbi:MAG: hypothetical protein HKN19_14170 [Halioglobus sp.]|nr:hypothetical protein [Halioglobus sp.]